MVRDFTTLIVTAYVSLPVGYHFLSSGLIISISSYVVLPLLVLVVNILQLFSFAVCEGDELASSVVSDPFELSFLKKKKKK